MRTKKKICWWKIIGWIAVLIAVVVFVLLFAFSPSERVENFESVNVPENVTDIVELPAAQPGFYPEIPIMDDCGFRGVLRTWYQRLAGW